MIALLLSSYSLLIPREEIRPPLFDPSSLFRSRGGARGPALSLRPVHRSRAKAGALPYTFHAGEGSFCSVSQLWLDFGSKRKIVILE